MPLELQLKRSRFWYGRLEIGGRQVFMSLRVPVEGRPPASLRDEGDAAFERSRARAQAKLDDLARQLRERATREELAQRVLEIRTGARLGSVALSEMAERWIDLPRSHALAELYVASSVSKIKRFVGFLDKNYPAVKEMSAVQDEMAAAFMAAEIRRGVSGATYNKALTLLRSCFSRLRKAAGIAENPFDDLPMRELDAIHRVPFTAAEVAALIKASNAADPYIHRLIVTGACTAMRLGDCAMLRWQQVDLIGGFINVKTSKTRRLVTIPIFPVLRNVLEAQPRHDGGYVYPDLAMQYRVNSGLLTDRVRRVLVTLGFGDGAGAGGSSLGDFHQTRQGGLRRASIRDFHSLRVTWVTIALNAGVPLDLVRKVTGHQTVEVVLTNYHQPSREDFRRELAGKLPLALTGGADPEKLTLKAIEEKVAGMTAENWRAIRDEIAAGIRRAGGAAK